jgi:hypothetical protein
VRGFESRYVLILDTRRSTKESRRMPGTASRGKGSARDAREAPHVYSIPLATSRRNLWLGNVSVIQVSKSRVAGVHRLTRLF